MSLFVETSALVAILLEEEGWQALTARIEADNRPTTCAVCLFEAGFALTARIRALAAGGGAAR